MQKDIPEEIKSKAEELRPKGVNRGIRWKEGFFAAYIHFRNDLAEKESRIKQLEGEIAKLKEVHNPISLERVVRFLERTESEKWCTGVVKTKENQSCVMGHVFDMGGDYFWSMFEEIYATTFMIYPVNDGDHPDYQQATPKERVISYLKDMLEGKVKTTIDHMNDYDNMRREELIDKKHIIDKQKEET